MESPNPVMQPPLPESAPTPMLGSDDECIQKVQYPKAVIFIVINVFCERFSRYGVRALLAIYLHKILLYSVDSSTVIFHLFLSLCFFFPVLGAIIADSLLGKFRTIIYLSVVCTIGTITLSVASADDAIAGMPSRVVSMTGLALVAIGMGGLVPCVSAFGGNQFVLPQQQKQLERFFSMFIFTANFGCFLSVFLMPIVREDIHCLGKDSCYPLAFGIPAIVMVTSLVVFLVGKKFYIMKNPEGNILMEIIKVIWHASRAKWKTKEKKPHWLDHAADKYGAKSISDIKALMQVIILFIPLPLFSALEDQQGSRWTFQATRMNGAIGSWVLKPEQMQLLNPLMILALVPLFETVLYPLMGKCNLLTTPLQRLGCGGILAGVAFLISAGLEINLEPTYAVVAGPGEGQLRFYNGFDCPLLVTLGNDTAHTIRALDIWEMKHFSVSEGKELDLTIEFNSTACSRKLPTYSTKVALLEQRAVSYMITFDSDNNGTDVEGPLYDDVQKTSSGNPKIRMVFKFLNDEENPLIYFVSKNKKRTNITLHASDIGTEYIELDATRYDVVYNGEPVAHDLNLQLGGVYTFLLTEKGEVAGSFETRLHTITQPNSVHMLWLLPQYVVLTMGEVMFSVTGTQFSYTQAPTSMKSVLQAVWLLNVAFGNVIVVIIAQCQIFTSQRNEFLLFACLMFLDMIVFAEIAWNYRYVETQEEEDSNDIVMEIKKNNGVTKVEA